MTEQSHTPTWLLNYLNLLQTEVFHKYLNILKILFESKLWLGRKLTFIVAHDYETPYRNRKRVLYRYEPQQNLGTVQRKKYTASHDDIYGTVQLAYAIPIIF